MRQVLTSLFLAIVLFVIAPTGIANRQRGASRVRSAGRRRRAPGASRARCARRRAFPRHPAPCLSPEGHDPAAGRPLQPRPWRQPGDGRIPRRALGTARLRHRVPAASWQRRRRLAGQAAGAGQGVARLGRERAEFSPAGPRRHCRSRSTRALAVGLGTRAQRPPRHDAHRDVGTLVRRHHDASGQWSDVSGRDHCRRLHGSRRRCR